MVVFNFAAFDYLEFLVFLSQNCSGPSESDAEDFSRRPFYGAPWEDRRLAVNDFLAE